MNTSEGKEELFREIRVLTRRMRLVISVAGLGMVVFFSWALIGRLFVGGKVGGKPVSDTMLAAVSPFFISLGVVFLWLSISAKLETLLRRDGVYIRYHPFHFSLRKIPAGEIAAYEGCTRENVMGGGGSGIRFWLSKVAYDIMGDRGVRLVMKDGKTILIGSERPGELVSAIDRVVSGGR